MPETVPEAPPARPATEPAPQPRPPAEPDRKRRLDPFNPPWPHERPVPEPKALVLSFRGPGDAALNEPDGYLQDEINKRLTLNLLIQGSAQHAFLTSHYLVRDELAELSPGLLRLYDKVALAGFIQYWCGEFVLYLGWPDRFWRRASSHPGHPFYRHPLLSRHGRELAQTAKQRAYARCREKGVTRIPVVFSLQLMKLLIHTALKERKHRDALVELAKQATHQVWGIPCERLDGKLTRAVAFGQPRAPTTFSGAVLRAGVAGYGGVLNGPTGLRVVARAWMWPILSHELVKGTVELICMHGLNELDAETYQEVVKVADRIEHEPWMLQVGAELWRRLLALLPDGRPVAEMIMHMARLPARSLETLMLAVVENGEWARELLAGLGQETAEEDEEPAASESLGW